MSMSAILQATLATLRDNVSLVNAENSGIRRQDGKPPPTAGQIFYAVHPSRWYPGPSHGAQNIGADELFDIGVTVTMRTGRLPSSRLTAAGYLGVDPATGEPLSLPENMGGIEPRLREIIVVISRYRYTILNTANDRLLVATDNPVKTFDAADVDSVNDQLTITAHGFGLRGTKTKFQFIEDESGSVDGLTDGEVYQAVIVDENTVKLPKIALGTGSTGEDHGARQVPSGFIEPLAWMSSDAEPREVDEEWFTAEPGDTRAQGWIMSASFGGARRLQKLVRME